MLLIQKMKGVHIMTIEMFIVFYAAGSILSSLLTQAMKKAFKNLSSNMLALAAAVCVGVFGTAAGYIFMDIPFDLKNVICMLLMGLCVWIGSMVGYDKVIQTIEQIKKGWDYV